MLKSIMFMAMLVILGSFSASAGALEESISAWLKQRFPDTHDVRWEIAVLQGISEDEFRENGANAWQYIYAGTIPKRIMDLQACHSLNQRKVMIRIQARRMTKALVASQLIPNGGTIGRAWHWEERELDALPRDRIRKPEELAGKRARKIFRKNEVFTDHALEPEPAVKTGSRLTLRVLGEGVVISTDVLAMEEGRPGNWIKLKCLGSNQVVKAEIVDQNTALIALSKR